MSKRESAKPKEGQARSTAVPEWRQYLCQLPGLWSGRTVPVFDIGVQDPGPIGDRSDDELNLLIEVAKRQLDAFQTQLEEIRQRAQFLFTTLLVLIGLSTAALRSIATDENMIAFLLWTCSLIVTLLALLGSTAIIVTKKTMGTIDAAWISRQETPWLPALANDAMQGAKASWTTVANQLTYFRDAALLTLLGAITLFTSWGLTLR